MVKVLLFSLIQDISRWKIKKFRDGKLNEGILSYSDGENYEGDWKDGKYNGQGIYTYANGSKYVGAYRMGNIMVRVDTLLLMVVYMKVESRMVNIMAG